MSEMCQQEVQDVVINGITITNVNVTVCYCNSSLCNVRVVEPTTDLDCYVCGLDDPNCANPVGQNNLIFNGSSTGPFRSCYEGYGEYGEFDK